MPAIRLAFLYECVGRGLMSVEAFGARLWLLMGAKVNIWPTFTKFSAANEGHMVFLNR